MRYDETGSIKRKTQTDATTSRGQLHVRRSDHYDFAYAYGGPPPQAATRRRPQLPLRRQRESNRLPTQRSKRDITWNEEIPISSLADNGQHALLLHADGQRTHKRLQQGETSTSTRSSSSLRPISTKQVFAGPTASPARSQIDGERHPFEQFLTSIKRSPGRHHYVTDENAKIFQHDEYFPSGRPGSHESSNTQRTPYLFTARSWTKPGSPTRARYYDPRVGVWQSPDPILTAYLRQAVGRHLRSRRPQSLLVPWNHRSS